MYCQVIGTYHNYQDLLGNCSFFGYMKVTKCVWQYHDKKDELEPVFDYFKYCANEAIRIGIEKNLTSKFKLHYQLYNKLRLSSKFHSKYVYDELECAASK